MSDATERRSAAEGLSSDEILAVMNASSAGTLVERMEIEFIELTKDRLVARMPVWNTQPTACCTAALGHFAETLGSIGAVLHAAPGQVSVGIDINATHHRAARAGFVTGVARPISVGRTFVCYEIVVSDEAGKRCCTSRITCMLRDAAPGA